MGYNAGKLGCSRAFAACCTSRVQVRTTKNLVHQRRFRRLCIIRAPGAQRCNKQSLDTTPQKCRLHPCHATDLPEGAVAECTDDGVVREDVGHDVVLPRLLQQPDCGLCIAELVASRDGGVVRHLWQQNRDIMPWERRPEHKREAWHDITPHDITGRDHGPQHIRPAVAAVAADQADNATTTHHAKLNHKRAHLARDRRKSPRTQAKRRKATTISKSNSSTAVRQLRSLVRLEGRKHGRPQRERAFFSQQRR